MLEGVKAQKPQLVEPAPAPRVRGYTDESTVGGFFRAETTGYLSSGESSEGRIPRALPVRNKTGKASKGASRQEGSQTLKAEDGGRW